MQPITKIEIKNFKSIRHAEIKDCRRVNVFIGYPNVGKSNILEAIGLFSFLQIGNEHLRFNDICRVKHFSELFFNQDSKETNNVIINDAIRMELITNQANDLDVRTQVLIKHVDEKDTEWVSILTSTVTRDFSFRVETYPREISYKHIVGTVRKYEFQKDIAINGSRPHALAIPSGNNLLDVLQRDGNLRKEIAGIFGEYGLKLVMNRKDESIEFQKELNDGTAVSIPYHQVADTLRRLIFFKAAVKTNSKAVLLFEEPEAHMFPPYIRKLTTDIILDKNDNQYFIATHSSYVLDELMGEIENDLSIFLVDYKEGETRIHHLEMEQIAEIREYGVDLLFNIESYLKNGQIDNA